MEKIEIQTNIKWNNILVEINEWYSFGSWFTKSIENWLKIWYNYWLLKSKKTWDKVWFWRIIHITKEVNVKKKKWYEKLFNI
jgi:hypothetical protein